MRIELLGGLNVLLDGQAAPRFRSQKPPALLAYLAYFADRHHPRELLIEMLWPDADPEAGRNRLSVTLSRIRAHLLETSAAGASTIQADRFHLWIDRGLVQTDIGELEAHLASAQQPGADRFRHLAEALNLCRGPLLPGFYESWIASEQERICIRIQQATSDLIYLLEASGRVDEALFYAKRHVAAEPLREEAHRDVIRLLIRQGKAAEAIKQYRALERFLRDELGVGPDIETQELIHEIRKPAPSIDDWPMTIGSGPAKEEERSYGAIGNRASRLGFADGRGSRDRRNVSRKPLAWLLLAGIFGIPVLVFGFKPRIPKNGKPSIQSSAPARATERREPLWTRRYKSAPDESYSELTAVTSDSTGNIYVTGFIKTTSHDVDLLTLKYSPNGKLLWKHRYDGPGNDCDRGRYIAVDRIGNVYVSGDSYNGDRAKRGTEWDCVTLKYDSHGSLLWRQQFNEVTNFDDVPAGMGLDANGNIYVAGTTRKPDRRAQVVVMKYRSDGFRLWAVHPPPAATGMVTSDIALHSFLVEPSGSLFLTGEGEDTDATGRKTRDMLTYHYDRHGNLIWGRRFASETPGTIFGRASAVDKDRNVFVAATHQPKVKGQSLPPGTRSFPQSPTEPAPEEVVVVKYDPSGEVAWSTSFENPFHGSQMSPSSLTLDEKGYILVDAIYSGRDGPIGSVICRISPSGYIEWTESEARMIASTMLVAGPEAIVLSGVTTDNPHLYNNVMRTERILGRNRLDWVNEHKNKVGIRIKQNAMHRDRFGNIITVGQTEEKPDPGAIIIKLAP